MVYKLKTQINNANVTDFLNSLEDQQKREDSFKLLDIFRRISQCEAKMWWSTIIGFGTYTYKYASGQTWDWMRIWFSPRKTGLSIYIMPGYNFSEIEILLSKLWKYKSGKSCLNIKKLSDIDLKVLEEIIHFWLKEMERMYPE